MVMLLIYSIITSEQSRNILIHEIRDADDLHVPYGTLDVRKFSIKIAGANLWSSFPLNIKNPTYINLFSRIER